MLVIVLAFLLILSQKIHSAPILVWSDTTSAHTYLEKGDSLYEANEYNYAIESFQIAARAYDQVGYFQRTAYCYNKIAQSYIESYQYTEAQIYAEKALAEVDSNTSLLKADIYATIGDIYTDLAIYDSAVSYYQQVINIRTSKLGDQHPQMTNSYFNIGSIYGRMNKKKEALHFLQQTIAVSDTTDKDMTNTLYADVYTNIGTIYTVYQEYDSALFYYEEALSIRLSTDKRDDLQLAMLFLNTGIVHFDRREFALALEYFYKAANIAEQTVGEDHPITANVYSSIGNALGEQRNQQAIHYFQKSLTVFKEVYGPTHLYIGRYYSNIGAVYANFQQYDSALLYHKKSLVIYNNISNDHFLDKAEAYYNIGNVYRNMHDYKRATDNFHKGAKTGKNLSQEHYTVISNLIALGDVYYQMNMLDTALHYYQRGITNSSSSFGNSSGENYVPIHQDYLVRSLYGKAKTLERMYIKNEDQNYLTDALQAYRQCDVLVDQLQQLYQTFADKITLESYASEIYEGAIRTALTLQKVTDVENYVEEAFYFAEKYKTGLLIEALSNLTAKSISGIPDSVLAIERKIKTERSFYQSQLQQELAKTEEYDTSQVNRYRSKLFDFNRRYDSLVRALEQQFPKYQQLKYSAQPLKLADIQQQLPNSTALLEYFVGDSSIYIFTITNQQARVISLTKDSTFSVEVQAWRDQLSRPAAHSDTTAYHLLTTLGKQLYDQWIAPALAPLDTAIIQHLVLVPDGELAYLPMEALLTQTTTDSSAGYKSLSYLGKRYVISYGYSSTWLFTNLPTQTSRNNHLVAFAPSYQSAVTDSAQQDRFRNQITPLVWNQQEARSIGQFFRGDVWVGSTAKEYLFKTEAPQYDIIHLAMHALVDDEQPMNSQLVFAASNDSTEDNILYTHEIYGMELPAQLVVLSACNTGFGKLERGEGIMSLARAFAYAGCPSLVTSHWAVDDEATAHLMETIYRYLSEGMPKDVALQRAKLDFLQNADDDLAHPFYWSGFALVGDTAPIIQSDATSHVYWYVLIGLLLLIVALVGIVWLRRRFAI